MKHLSLGLLGLTLSFVFATRINAAESAEQEAVVVTATRTAETVDETLASVSVISRTDIEQSQANNITELLRLQAGIDIARSGGPGQQTGLFLRGTNSNQTLVLIDGVRAASPTTGAFAWPSLSLTDIERIEIVRGPRASLYGSDAIGGVIQIFTRDNKGMHVRGQVGSYNSKLAEAGIGGGDDVKYSLNVTTQDTDGFSATNEKLSYFNPDNDGYKNSSASGKLAFTLGTKTELRFSAWYADSENDYDDGLQENNNGIFDARLVNQTTANWQQTLSAGLSKDKSNFVGASIYNTERLMADWQHNFTLGLNHSLTAGLSTVKDQATNIDLFTDSTVYDESIRNNAAFVELQSRFGQHDLNLSGRLDDYENFGNHSTGNIAWGYNLRSALRLTASYGTAYRAPSLNELYSPGYFGFYAGNPDLQPETSRTLEFGLRYKSAPNQHLSISIYRNDIKNLIANEGFNFQSININEAQIDGLELEYQYTQTNWSLLTALTLQNAVNKLDNSDLLRRPREKVSLQVRRALPNEGSIGLEWLYVGERLDRSFLGDVTLDPYHLINLSGVVKMAKNLWMEARVDNLFDEDYELVYGYNTPGLSVFVGVNYKLPE
ncbi:MAG: TonB-dependent receptor domain-containing protein [Gammaproteobacteria bacterium]